MTTRSKTTFRGLTAAILGGTAIAAATLAPAYADEPIKITILGVGDIYQFNGDGDAGGFARLNAVARA